MSFEGIAFLLESNFSIFSEPLNLFCVSFLRVAQLHSTELLWKET